MEGEVSEPAPGQEFLTWLWFKAETQLGQIALSDGRVVSVLVEGPLVFRREGQGAHAVVLKKGAPESSAEAKTCLMGGKKLKEARLTLALDGERVWSFGFEADEFLVRGLKLPQSAGALDGLSRFQERMVFLEEWREMFLDLFGAFVGVRGQNGEVWEIRRWVARRPSRGGSVGCGSDRREKEDFFYWGRRESQGAQLAADAVADMSPARVGFSTPSSKNNRLIA